jgi:hypothetical protein
MAPRDSLPARDVSADFAMTSSAGHVPDFQRADILKIKITSTARHDVDVAPALADQRRKGTMAAGNSPTRRADRCQYRSLFVLTPCRGHYHSTSPLR